SVGLGLRLKVRYHCHRFDDAAITRLLGHWKTLLEGMAANPVQHLATLPLLTMAERHQLLVSWNDTAAQFPKHKCVHHLFEEQAWRTPDALAVADAQKQLTYGELNQHANQLARP